MLVYFCISKLKYFVTNSGLVSPGHVGRRKDLFTAHELN